MKKNFYFLIAKLIGFICAIFLALNGYANPYISINGGYGSFANVWKNDGSGGLLRIALGANTSVARLQNKVLLGGELGVQTGNSMKINMGTAADVFTVPVAITIQPPIDLLLSLKYLFQAHSFFLQLKAGGAYLKAVLNNVNTIPNKSQIRPELQVGAGIGLSEKTRIVISYQQIFGHTPSLTNVSPTLGTATLSNLPTLQAGFIGIELDL